MSPLFGKKDPRESRIVSISGIYAKHTKVAHTIAMTNMNDVLADVSKYCIENDAYVQLEALMIIMRSKKQSDFQVMMDVLARSVGFNYSIEKIGKHKVVSFQPRPD